MRQVTQAFPHLDLVAVKDKVKTATKHWERQKWLVVYNAMVDPRSASEIAKHIGVSKGFVRKVIQVTTVREKPPGRLQVKGVGGTVT
jgi:hypothetical protein